MNFDQATTVVTLAKIAASQTTRSLTYRIECHNGQNPDAVHLTLRSAPSDGAPTQRRRIRTNDYAKAMVWLKTGFPEAYRRTEDAQEGGAA